MINSYSVTLSESIREHQRSLSDSILFPIHFLRSSFSMSLYLQWIKVQRISSESSMICQVLICPSESCENHFHITRSIPDQSFSIPVNLQWINLQRIFISYSLSYGVQYQSSFPTEYIIREHRDHFLRSTLSENIYFLRSSFSSPDQWQSFPIHCPTEYSYNITSGSMTIISYGVHFQFQ